MTVSQKLALALILGISAVMIVDAYVRVAREISVFEDDQASDQHDQARLVSAAVRRVWANDGEPAAQTLVNEEAEVSVADSHLAWVWLDDQNDPALHERLSAANVDTLEHDGEVTMVANDGDGETRRYLYIPLALPGSRPAALELSEPLSPPRWVLRSSVLQNLLATIIMIVVCGAFAIGLGSWLVGRPLRRLGDKARRVGGGDFSGRLDFSQRDEVGQLAREIDAMCDRLAEATRRAAADNEARILALDQLRHADRLKTVGQLASGVAHELGTPLNVISGRAKMIGGGALDAPDLTKSTRIIIEQSERMAAIIRQLLDFSRRRQPRIGVSEIHRITARALEMMAPLAQERHVTISFDARGASTPVEVDEHQILQAITNLILNGIQAMPNGGTLTVRTATVQAAPPRPQGRQNGVAEAEFACVSIEDEGEGIPADALPHIFEPFFTTKGVGEGTGLGLSVAYGIVEDHGGWIEVHTEPGTGARFTVFLRAAAAASPATATGRN